MLFKCDFEVKEAMTALKALNSAKIYVTFDVDKTIKYLKEFYPIYKGLIKNIKSK